ncbi:ABC transporter substrate-binding protein [Pelomonas sp. Root1237]|uniref:substrate-binding periplasmic protein n=1 Tax=Pelomonas sp. Root1237 TaxID=1736434 RepID=UPI0009E665E3|nr:transporter substrate-binding domain-containing protein [Pelomonas sp. Root1237]
MMQEYKKSPRPSWARWHLLALTLTLLAWVCPCPAEPAVLRIVAPTSQSMPMLRMAEQRPVAGLLKDLGEVFARQLGLSPVFLPLPSKRAALAVESGAADLLCYAKPEWLEADVLWTQLFLSGTGIIAAGPDSPAVSQLQDLRDEPLGTVLGYRYPAIDQVLARPIAREDVADAETNLRRLALGRVRYAVTDRAALAHYVKSHPTSNLREVLEVEPYRLGCALSPAKADLLQPLNRVIDRMRVDGTLEKLLNRYR